MDSLSNLRTKLLAENDSYYNNVFKRTENITKAVLYILTEIKETEKTKFYLNKIKDKVFKTHDTVLSTLQIQDHEQSVKLKALRQELVELSSYISLAQPMRIISKSVAELLLEQIDRIIRYLNNHWLCGTNENDLLTDSNKGNSENVFNYNVSVTNDDRLTGYTPVSVDNKKSKLKTTRVKIPEGDISSDAYLVYSQLSNRGERIKTILAAKPEATIKDISEVITDVSEKTIQRELNDLIKKGQVIREGERRWSRYSLRS